MKLFKDKRESMFPDIKDFSDPQNELRYSHPNNLTFAQFIWFSPKFYIIYKLGMPTMYGFLSLVGSYLLYIKGSYFLSTIFGVFFVMAVYKLLKEYSIKYTYKHSNFYDSLIRD